ncbi:hypothetical protein [Lactococcus sp.]|uniref:hypothetical protein n=1 Tax=Lactococcus sp. TaxID=44273 RepID=UPI002FC769CF
MKINEKKIRTRIENLGFEALSVCPPLTELSGSYLNNLTKLPNGESAKILNDNKTYLAAQIEPESEIKCWGIAADDEQIAIFSYSNHGSDCELLAWVKI